MKYVGVDLTSAFAQKEASRPVDIATLEGNCIRLTTWTWPEPDIVNRANERLAESFTVAIEWDPDRTIVCIDGPQALSSHQEQPRVAEQELRTPGRTPFELPRQNDVHPFAGYIRSSILLFQSLLETNGLAFGLAGNKGLSIAEATLFEVFPGAEWSVLLGRRPPKKTSREGRRVRQAIWRALRLEPEDAGEPLTADQNDAIVAAVLGKWAREEPHRVQLVGSPPVGEPLREGHILHASTQLKEVDAPDLEERVDEGQPQTDWARDTLLIAFTDNGAVHGSEPQNIWLVPGHNYDLVTQDPHPHVPFRLIYSPHFPGARSWTCQPVVQQLLGTHLGLQAPAHLSRERQISVAVEVAPD